MAAEAERIVIPRCIGCGAMYEVERCETGCRMERVELIAQADLEALEAAAARARTRIEAMLVCLEQLAGPVPATAECERVYPRLAAEAGTARRAAAVLRGAVTDGQAAPALQPITVWRCPACGAVDAPQECLGICIWRRFAWVDTAAQRPALARAQRTSQLELDLDSLLARVAHTAPRQRQYRRNWRAFAREAHGLCEAWAAIEV